jgi:hypothetical protein
MPITVTAPRGVLTPAGEIEILPRLSEAVIAANGLLGNPFFKEIVGGHVELVDARDVYAGGRTAALVTVKLELPNLGLPTVEARRDFIERASAIVDALTIDAHRPFNTWISIFPAPDGGWGFDGRAWTNDELVAAVTDAAAQPA